jgi:nucleoid DNA-binding protein
LNLINLMPVKITPIIRELLLHNQKAVIPGFGSFFILQHSAELNRITHVITPPSIEICFDQSQQSDNGQLSEYLVKRLKQNHTLAQEAIGQFVKTAEDELRSKGVLLLEGLGVLTLEKSGQVTFKPDEELVKRTRLFELPRLNMPIAQPVSSARTPDAPKERYVPAGRKKRRWWIPAALVAFLFGLFAVGYFTGIYEGFTSGSKSGVEDNESVGSADRIVFGDRVEADSSFGETDTLKEKISQELDDRTARENALAYKEAESNLAVQNQNPLSEAVQPVATNLEKPYHIISGAFLVPNNAERQKRQLETKGFAPALLPKRGDYFMVSIGSYDTHEKAVMAMRQMRGKLKQELWVMKR